MGLKSDMALFLLLASLFVTSTLALRLLNDDEVVDALVNQLHEDCQRRCQSQGHRGQSPQWQCQKRCKEDYGYDREGSRGGRYGEWGDEVELDNDRFEDRQKRYRKCQRRCQKQGQGQGQGHAGQWQCQKRCEEEYQRQSQGGMGFEKLEDEDEIDQNQGPYKWECEVKCQKQGEGPWECQRKCQGPEGGSREVRYVE